MKYRVIKQHYGDRQYWAGDEREINSEPTAKELVAKGLIAPLNKAEPVPKNKMAKAPQNKAAK